MYKELKITIHPNNVERAEKLYQEDIAWCLEAGCSPHADITAYLNFLLFKKLDEEEEFFIRRALIKKSVSYEDK